jgi:hypothetical protein
MDQAVEALRNRRKSDRESVLRYLYRCAVDEYMETRNWSVGLFAKQLGIRQWDFHFWLTHAQSDLTDQFVIPRLETFLAKEERLARGQRLA